MLGVRKSGKRKSAPFKNEGCGTRRLVTTHVAEMGSSVLDPYEEDGANGSGGQRRNAGATEGEGGTD